MSEPTPSFKLYSLGVLMVLCWKTTTGLHARRRIGTREQVDPNDQRLRVEQARICRGRVLLRGPDTLAKDGVTAGSNGRPD